ncbi:hypothetical protein R3W88_033218 [Solanum pinnatisectum]|uniref:Uncharacterized protein n=1 Tax=Solanum pinnatisectum TaxID=50273 RepID=A0AAV9K2Q5_9SOLN|nr:hypothetical protein R3W88_033218 [Solanum pinnatisectum]
MIWLGTFNIIHEVSVSYKSKEIEFEELVIAKYAKEDQISEISRILIVYRDLVNISEGREVIFSHKLGIDVIDNCGFLLGELSVLDDLRIYV